MDIPLTYDFRHIPNFLTSTLGAHLVLVHVKVPDTKKSLHVHSKDVAKYL